MDTALVMLLIAMAGGVGLCLGYLIGHQAAHDRENRRGKAAKSYLDALEKRDDVDRARGDVLHVSTPYGGRSQIKLDY